MKLALPMTTLLIVALSACAGERADDGADTAPIASAPADQPADDVPPATAPIPATPPPSGPAPAPADGAIGFAGFGPATFGADEEAVRKAWGKDIKADVPGEPGGCYYLYPQPRPQGSYGTGFMMENDKFARIDVDSADIVAPGGGRIGVTADVIRKLYAGRVEEQKHKYGDGNYLRIKDSSGGPGVLVFETDDKGSVTKWRIGVPPQIDYVEGCS